MRRSTSLAALLVLGLAGSAFAQDRGSQADQDACEPDVFRLCSAYIPNESAIVSCLQSSRRSLSRACYNVFYPSRASRDLDTMPTGSLGKAHVRKAIASHKRKAARAGH